MSLRKWFLVFFLFLLLGFVLTYEGTITWDMAGFVWQSHWLVERYVSLIKPVTLAKTSMVGGALERWYGPLWPLIAGVVTAPFLFLTDIFWPRTAVNFALFPMTLIATFYLVVRAGYSRATAWLGVACLFGVIRFGGHSIENPKDFPFACAHLLGAIYLWLKMSKGTTITHKEVFFATTAAVAVYLTRIPAIFHLVAWLGYCLFQLIRPSVEWTQKKKFFLPFLVVPILLLVFHPILWVEGILHGLIEPFRLFSKFVLDIEVRVLGYEFMSSKTPWWYPLVWFPIIVHPVVLIIFVVGLFSVATRPKGIHLWLLGFSVGLMALISLKKTVLFDEERHLLFLYPPLALLGALGWDRFKDKTKYIAAACTILVSSVTYVHWGIYSYVYKSPILGSYANSRYFMGDYLGICINRALRELHDIVPGPTTIRVDSGGPVFDMQHKRLAYGLLSGIEGYGPYLRSGFNGGPFTAQMRPEKFQYEYALSLNRIGFKDDVVEGISSGRYKVLWKDTMADGEIACMIWKKQPVL